MNFSKMRRQLLCGNKKQKAKLFLVDGFARAAAVKNKKRKEDRCVTSQVVLDKTTRLG